MALTTTILLLSLIYLLVSFTYRLLRNIWICRRTGLPMVVIPLHRMNPIALLSRDLVTGIIKRLPFGLDDWKYLHFFYRDWEFRTKFQQFEEYGEVFMEVSSGGRACYIGSAEVAQQVFQSRNGFLKDIDFYSMRPTLYLMNKLLISNTGVVRVYGDNVLTVSNVVRRL
jgi:hypothetical protein